MLPVQALGELFNVLVRMRIPYETGRSEFPSYHMPDQHDFAEVADIPRVTILHFAFFR